MNQRQELVERLKELFPPGNFIYGDYKSKPSLPYGNYGRQEMNIYKADDKPWLMTGDYIVRLVTQHKDFDLEHAVMDIFNGMELNWRFFDESMDKNEKCFAVEFVVELLEGDDDE